MAWEKDPRLVQLMNFAPSLTITILNVLLPFIFKKLCLFEDWSPSFEVTINMSRYVSFIHPLAIFCCIKSLIKEPDEQVILSCLNNHQVEFYSMGMSQDCVVLSLLVNCLFH